MIKTWLIVLLTAWSFNSIAYERVSFYKLIVSPHLYENKKLQLTGFFTSAGADCLVISNDKETAMMFREYEMVKFCSEDLDEGMDSVMFKQLASNYGSIAGVFLTKQCGGEVSLGSTLRYLGCFKRVTQLFGPIYEGGPQMPPPPLKSEL